MRVDADVLIDILRYKLILLNNQNVSRKVRKELIYYMVKEYNVQAGYATSIIEMKVKLEELSYGTLYKVMNAVKDVIKLREDVLINTSDLDEDIYFFEDEITRFKKPLVYPKKEKTDIVFTEWLKLEYDRYSSKATGDDFVTWENIGRITYNPDTQRDLIETVIEDGIDTIVYKKIDINSDAINKMCGLILKGDFICEDITLNINTDTNTTEDSLVCVRGGRLIIPKNAKIDILDGWHRLKAICMAKAINPDIQFVCGIKITMYNNEKANDFMLLQDKKTHFKKEQAKRIDKNDESNFIITTLKQDSHFLLRGSIDNDAAYNLNLLIRDIFDPKNTPESIQISKIIKDKLNELVMEKECFDKKFNKEEWLIYLYLAKLSKVNGCDFMNMVNKLNIDYLVEEVKYVNKPSGTDYKKIDKMINEVRIDV